MILGGVVLAGAAAIGVMLFIASRHVPRIPGPSANRNPIVADVKLPADGGGYPNNGSLPISVALDSQKPVQLVQVWLDGELVADAVPKKGDRQENLSLPGSILAGDNLHTLVVTVVDADGRSAAANAVRVRGIPPVPAKFIITTKGGDSLQSIASHFNTDLSNVMDGNPNLFGANRFAAPRYSVSLFIRPSCRCLSRQQPRFGNRKAYGPAWRAFFGLRLRQ